MLAVDPVTVRAAFYLIKMQTTAEKKLPERRRRSSSRKRAGDSATGTSIAKGNNTAKKKRKAKEKQSSSKVKQPKPNKQPATGCGLVGARGMPGTWHKACGMRLEARGELPISLWPETRTLCQR